MKAAGTASLKGTRVGRWVPRTGNRGPVGGGRKGEGRDYVYPQHVALPLTQPPASVLK